MNGLLDKHVMPITIDGFWRQRSAAPGNNAGTASGIDEVTRSSPVEPGGGENRHRRARPLAAEESNR
jgi:hypothetical protein